MKALWNDTLIAESNETVVVEGNHYFPMGSVREEFLDPAEQTSTCPWKVEASYFDIVVNGERNAAAAWMYRDPLPAAANIKDHVAFWKGVTIVE